MGAPKIGWKAFNEQRSGYLKEYFQKRHASDPASQIKRAADWYAANREDALRRQKEYRLANPLTDEQKARKRALAAERRALNPEKAKDNRHAGRAKRKVAGPDLTRAKIRELLDNAVCTACGSADHPEIDHVMPIALGGTHDDDNLQILCRPCNRSKGSKHPAEWAGRHVR